MGKDKGVDIEMGLSERDREVYKSSGSNTDVCDRRAFFGVEEKERDRNAGLFMIERVAVARAWQEQSHFQ
jgi:hypothetical protein